MADLIEGLRHGRIPADAEIFREEVRDFLRVALPPASADERSRSWLAFDAAFSRQLAARGWVGLTLPRRFGGAELDPFHRFVLVEELLCVGAPVAAHWFGDRQSGPLILRYGTEDQKARYLPKLCRGEIFFCVGMSEPDAGSDLASVRSHARRTHDGWVLNGRKIWTTHGDKCDYQIALVRTSGTPADRHAGLSQFVIDLKLPGITIRPITDLTGDAHFCEVFFDDVHLAHDALIGMDGQGWEQVNAELAFERSGPERFYSSIVLLNCWIEWLRQSGRLEQQTDNIGRLVAHLSALREMSIAVTAQLASGESPLIEAAVVKDLGTAFEQEIPSMVASSVGADPDCVADAELMRALNFVSQVSPTFSLRGGAREVLRGVIAKGLGLR